MAEDGMGKVKIGSFTAVGGNDAAGMIAWISRIERFPQAVALRERSYRLLALGPGDAVADVGCGAGAAVEELGALTGAAVGIDISEQMIGVGRSRFPERDFRVGSAYELPFTDGELAGYRAERVFQHLDDPRAALAEAARVLAPGGRVVLLDQDYDTPAFDSDDLPLCRAILRAQSDAVRQRWIGRQYRALLLDAGFTQVELEVNTLVYTDFEQLGPMIPAIAGTAVESGAVTRAQADAWLADQRRRGESDRFCATMPLFTASARRSG